MKSRIILSQRKGRTIVLSSRSLIFCNVDIAIPQLIKASAYTQFRKNHGTSPMSDLTVRFLIIRNIPVTDVISELIQQLALYGTIEEYNLVYDLPSAPFTQTVWVKFEKTSAAR